MDPVAGEHRRATDLLLTEHVFLLMVNGRTPSWADPSIVSGALLLDLERRGCLEQENADLVARQCETGEPLLERARTTIAGSSQRRDAEGWIKHLPKELDSLNTDLARELLERGLLVERRRKALGLFSSTRLDAAGLALEEELNQRLLSAFRTGSEPDENDCLLIVLVFPGDVVEIVPKDRRREAEAWMSQIHERWTDGTAPRVRGAQAAVLAAIKEATVGKRVHGGVPAGLTLGVGD